MTAYDGPSRLTGTLAKGQVYNYAVIEHERLGEVGGVCTDYEPFDGEATILLGGLLKVSGPCRYFGARRDA